MNETNIPCQNLPLQCNRSRQQTSCQRSHSHQDQQPTFNHSTQKMYIPGIFNSHLRADRPSDGSVKMADPDLPQSHPHLTISSNRFSPKQCIWQIKHPEFHNLINWQHSSHQLASIRSFLTLFKFKKGVKRCFVHPGSAL